VTAHMAWNLIQSYPTEGSGMSYQGHGLMWADVPWSGHYTVNSPIWVTAHYTQTSEVGWRYLPVGSGSGDLPSGGTFLTMVSDADADGKREFALVAQTMEYTNSQCFKDAHAAFDVANQTVVFSLSSDLIPKSKVLYVRRTQLFPGDPIDPYEDSPDARNIYYEEATDRARCIWYCDTGTANQHACHGFNPCWRKGITSNSSNHSISIKVLRRSLVVRVWSKRALLH